MESVRSKYEYEECECEYDDDVIRVALRAV